MGSIFALQVAVTMARSVSTYRLVALDASGGALGLAAASFALPPIVLGVMFGRWTERHHPGLMLAGGSALTAVAALALLSSQEVPAVAAATMLLGIGHMAGVIGGQSMVAQADSSIPRLSRFGVFTTSGALGQVVGPVLGGFIIGRSGEPTVGSTSTALGVAALVVGVGVIPALAALRATIRAKTMRVGKAERVWSLLRIRGMGPALLTSFSAKGAVDLMLVYMPLLGIALGFSAQEVGVLLGISGAGAMFARAGTPLLARRMPVLRLTTLATVVAGLCVLALPLSERLAVLVVLSALLGFSLGLTQTTTMAWVVGLVDDTSRGSALGLRVSTNRLGQAVVVAAAGAVSGALGVTSAFVMLGSIMLVTAAAGAFSERPRAGGHFTGE